MNPKAIFGLHAPADTETGSAATEVLLTVAGRPDGDGPPLVLKSTRGGSAESVPSGSGEWSIALGPGDHVIQVTGGIAKSIQISVDRRSAIVTTIVRGRSVAVEAFWTDDEIDVSDPKDPWAHAGSSDEPAALDPAAKAWFEAELLPLARLVPRGAEDGEIHALLVGIDDYPPGPGRNLYRSCRGCVRDVLDVDQFLRAAGVPAERIQLLVAPDPGVATAGRPTYDNIVASWLRLIEEVPSGAQIYIHYSGHGGRARTAVPEVKGASGLDEVLVPCDINDRTAGRYLRDVEVAVLLERMRAKGQVVTLVIDSCNSGGMMRGDAMVRQGDEIDLDPRTADERGSAVAVRAELVATAGRLSAARRAERSAWFFGASSHVILSACQQNELAYEYAFDGAEVRGAFTYFWLDAIRKVGPAASYHAVHRTVLAELHARFRQQSPALVGDGDRVVLGLDRVVRPRTIPVLRSDGGEVELGAGQAHMIRAGTQLAALPPGSHPELVDLVAMPILEVETVDATTSTARVVTGNPPPIGPGWHALPLSFGASQTRHVRLAAPGSTEGPFARAARAALAEVEAQLGKNGANLVARAIDHNANYIVTVSDESNPVFRIVDPGGAEVPHLGRPVATGEDRAASRVVERLVHLARFDNVLSYTNRSPVSPLAGCLGLELLALPRDYEEGDDAPPVPFAPGQPVKVPAGSWLCVRLENRGPVELHVVVLDLQPDWGISRLIPFDASTIALAPGQKLDHAVRAWLPDGHDVGTDVLKAIATVAPTDYDWMLLDPIGKPSWTQKNMARPSGKWTTVLAELHVFRA